MRRLGVSRPSRRRPGRRSRPRRCHGPRLSRKAPGPRRSSRRRKPPPTPRPGSSVAASGLPGSSFSSRGSAPPSTPPLVPSARSGPFTWRRRALAALDPVQATAAAGSLAASSRRGQRPAPPLAWAGPLRYPPPPLVPSGPARPARPYGRRRQGTAQPFYSLLQGLGLGSGSEVGEVTEGGCYPGVADGAWVGEDGGGSGWCWCCRASSCRLVVAELLVPWLLAATSGLDWR